jgi:hypothetical protein
VRQLVYLLFLISISFYGNTQTGTNFIGHFSRFTNPNMMGLPGLYCGNVNFAPYPLSYVEKLRIPFLEASSKLKGDPSTNFAYVYADARNILLDIKNSKGNPCAIKYRFYKNYNSKPDEEVNVSVSATGGLVKQKQSKKKFAKADKESEDEILLFNFFINEEATIKQLESYGNKIFPTATFSAKLNESTVFLDNDTLNVNILEGQNQLMLMDKKKRPFKTWGYDNQNRLTQFLQYEYSDLGLLRVDSTNIYWENTKVKEIKFKNLTTKCSYDSIGNISKIENYASSKLITVHNYSYTYDLKYNWITFEIQEYIPSKNNRSRKYFVKREITYRE